MGPVRNLGEPTVRLRVRRGAELARQRRLTLPGRKSLLVGRPRSLDELISQAYDRLSRGGLVVCVVCGRQDMNAAGCRSCGSHLS